MFKLKKTIVNTVDVLWVIISLNFTIMFIIVLCGYGGSPSPTQGSGINKKGEYVLQSHGRRTVVSKDDYDFCLNYYIISMSLLIFGAIGQVFLMPWLIPDHEKYSYSDKITNMKVSFKWLKKRR